MVHAPAPIGPVITGASDPWQPIETAPRCVDGRTDGTNGRRPVMVTRSPFVGHHAPMAVAQLTKKGWICGTRSTRLWFQPTHWMPLPDPPKQDGSLSATADRQGLSAPAHEQSPSPIPDQGDEGKGR